MAPGHIPSNLYSIDSSLQNNDIENNFSISQDSSSKTSSKSSTHSEIEEIIRDTNYNETEIIRAPQQYIDQFDEQFINNLETIQVTAEAPWDEAGENLLRRWMDEAKDNAVLHLRTGYRLKTKYRELGVSVIITTGLVVLCTSLFPCTDVNAYKYLNVFISFISLILANISAFYNYGPRYQLHFQYQGLYDRYAIDIEEVLVTNFNYRPPKDKTIVEFRERKGNLITSAPEL